MRFDVTQEDIDSGIPQKCSKCPVAICMIRTLGHFVSIYNQHGHLHAMLLKENCERFQILLPVDTHNWISWFDRYGRGNPFSFELEIP